MSRVILPASAHRQAGATASKLFRAQRSVAQVVPGEDSWLACARLTAGSALVASNYDPLIAQTNIALSSLATFGLLNLCMVYVPRSVVAARIGYGCDSLGLTSPDGVNALCIYSYDAIDESATLIDQCSSSVTVWANRSIFFSQPMLNGYTLGRGIYLIGGTAAGTATGNLYGRTVPNLDPNLASNANGAAFGGIVIPRAFEININIAGFTSNLPNTIDLSGTLRAGYDVLGGGASNWPWYGLYSA